MCMIGQQSVAICTQLRQLTGESTNYLSENERSKYEINGNWIKFSKKTTLVHIVV